MLLFLKYSQLHYYLLSIFYTEFYGISKRKVYTKQDDLRVIFSIYIPLNTSLSTSFARTLKKALLSPA